MPLLERSKSISDNHLIEPADLRNERPPSLGARLRVRSDQADDVWVPLFALVAAPGGAAVGIGGVPLCGPHS